MRKVSVRRSAAGTTVVTVRLTDGDFSASFSMKSVGNIVAARKITDQKASEYLTLIKEGS